jgi:hypothetical protein
MERAMARSALDAQDQLLDLEGLVHEVVRAGADRCDRSIEAAEGGDHDHRKIRSVAHDAGTQIQPCHSRHSNVGHHDVELLREKKRERFFARVPTHRLVATTQQTIDHHLSHGMIVLHHEHPRHAASPPCGSQTVKTEPRPASLTTSIQPPWSATMP